MRELIIDHQRRKAAGKRNAPGELAELESDLQPAAVLPELTDVLAVDAALERLRAENPEAAELVIDTTARSVPEATEDIERMLAASGVLFDEMTDFAANI
jgi:hypothetical protein